MKRQRFVTIDVDAPDTWYAWTFRKDPPPRSIVLSWVKCAGVKSGWVLHVRRRTTRRKEARA